MPITWLPGSTSTLLFVKSEQRRIEKKKEIEVNEKKKSERDRKKKKNPREIEKEDPRVSILVSLRRFAFEKLK